MTTAIELLTNGLSLGILYALIALGFVIIYRASHVLNFAHGSTLLAGAFVTATLQSSLSFFPAAVLGVATAVLIAVVIDLVLVRPGEISGVPVEVPVIITIGVDILLITELSRRIGTNVLDLGAPWGNSVVHLYSLTIPLSRFVALGATVVILAVFFSLFRYSGWGVSMRAAAEDGEAADLMGIRRFTVATTSWAIAGALATVAGLFLASYPSPGVDVTIATVALAAFPAAVIGGLDSPNGAVIGGLLLGTVQSFAAGYEDYISFLGSGFSTALPWILMLAVLLFRPQGLLGSKGVARV